MQCQCFWKPGSQDGRFVPWLKRSLMVYGVAAAMVACDASRSGRARGPSACQPAPRMSVWQWQRFYECPMTDRTCPARSQQGSSALHYLCQRFSSGALKPRWQVCAMAEALSDGVWCSCWDGRLRCLEMWTCPRSKCLSTSAKNECMAMVVRRTHNRLRLSPRSQYSQQCSTFFV